MAFYGLLRTGLTLTHCPRPSPACWGRRQPSPAARDPPLPPEDGCNPPQYVKGREADTAAVTEVEYVKGREADTAAVTEVE